MRTITQAAKAAYRKRCEQLLKTLGEGACVMLKSAPEVSRSGDVTYPYRQNNAMLYLTGCTEPNVDCLMYMAQGRLIRTLSCPETDAQKSQWIGPWTTEKTACEHYGVEQAVSHPQWPAYLKEVLGLIQVVYLDLKNPTLKLTALQKHFSFDLEDVMPLLEQQRLVKDAYEIDVLKTVCRQSAQAHRAVMQSCQPDWTEAHVEAMFLQQGRIQGPQHLAYPTIAAGGEHACILHYTRNDASLNAEDLLLIDAGMELEGYAADITRTFPVSGRFSDSHKALYDIVLAAQTTAIAQIKPGENWASISLVAEQVLIEGLVSLGILSGTVEHCLETEALRPFFPHRLGHHLGLDVHDVPEVHGITDPFEVGHVITIEPGLYCGAHLDIDPRWQGIGIRIEDDIWVTETGACVLTDAVPKTVDDIESLMCA